MKVLALVALSLTPQSDPAAPTDRPVLRAEAPRLDVRDGDLLYQREWEPDPSLPRDVYCVRRSAGRKRITVVSDRGELTFELEPGETRDFWLEIGDRRMPLQVSARTRPGRRTEPGAANGPVRIPIEILHGKLHVKGRINGSRELDLIFDTGASVSVLYPSATDKGAKFAADLDVMNNGESRRGLQLGGTVEVGGFAWRDEPVLFVEKQLDRADGILGYTVFEDRVLEFDYARMELVVHDTMPSLDADFVRAPMRYVGSLTAVAIDFAAGEWATRGEFLLDTGCDAAVLVDDHVLARELAARLEQIGSGRSEGVGPRVTQHRLLRVPGLALAGATLRDAPILAIADEAGGSDAIAAGVVGMPVLQRLDLWIDYPRGQVWLRPNARAGEPFAQPRADRSSAWTMVAAGAAGLLLLAGLRRLARRRGAVNVGAK